MKEYRQPVFDFKRGQELANHGLRVAVEKAEFDYPGWKNKCWDLFKRWISKKEIGFEFMIETFRTDCYKWNMLEKPKSERAFGFITKRAVKDGLIKFRGNGKVANVKAHSCFASVWVKL